MSRVPKFLVPAIIVGLVALLVSLDAYSWNVAGAPNRWLVPYGAALAVGILLPTYLGSVGAGFGWLIGVITSWTVSGQTAADQSALGFVAGMAIYAALACAFHAIGTAIRSLLRPRRRMSL